MASQNKYLRTRFNKSIFIWLILTVSFLDCGCFSTIDVTVSDLNKMDAKTIDVRIIDGTRYILETYSTTDSTDSLTGSGFISNNDSRKQFSGKIKINTIKNISYKEYSIGKTLTLVLVYLLLVGISSAG